MNIFIIDDCGDGSVTFKNRILLLFREYFVGYILSPCIATSACWLIRRLLLRPAHKFNTWKPCWRRWNGATSTFAGKWPHCELSSRYGGSRRNAELPALGHP